MARASALALAVLVCAAIFGVALLAVHWLLGSAGFWQTVQARWFPVALILFNSVTFSVVAGVALIRQRRAERRAQAEEAGLISASERFRRDVKGGGRSKF